MQEQNVCCHAWVFQWTTHVITQGNGLKLAVNSRARPQGGAENASISGKNTCFILRHASGTWKSSSVFCYVVAEKVVTEEEDFGDSLYIILEGLLEYAVKVISPFPFCFCCGSSHSL